MSSLQRIAVVTGASRGLGKAVCQQLLDQDIHVVGVSRSPSSIQHQLYSHCQADLTCAKDLQLIRQAVINQDGSLVALVNSAGALEPIAKVSDVNMDSWRQLFEINLHSVLSLTQLLLPLLRQGPPDQINGRIINISSGAATHAYQGWSAYCASKAALNMFTQSIAVEESPQVVSVAVAPGVVDTDMQGTVRTAGQGVMAKKEYSKFIDLHTNSQLLPPEKPARVLAQLALKATADISGQVFKWNASGLSAC